MKPFVFLFLSVFGVFSPAVPAVRHCTLVLQWPCIRNTNVDEQISLKKPNHHSQTLSVFLLMSFFMVPIFIIALRCGAWDNRKPANL